MMSEYAEKEWKYQPYIGETPVKIIDSVLKQQAAKRPKLLTPRR